MNVGLYIMAFLGGAFLGVLFSISIYLMLKEREDENTK